MTANSRGKLSTMSALLLFTEQLRDSLNKGNITGAIFIDFRKAFNNEPSNPT